MVPLSFLQWRTSKILPVSMKGIHLLGPWIQALQILRGLSGRSKRLDIMSLIPLSQSICQEHGRIWRTYKQLPSFKFYLFIVVCLLHFAERTNDLVGPDFHLYLVGRTIKLYCVCSWRLQVCKQSHLQMIWRVVEFMLRMEPYEWILNNKKLLITK